MGNGHLPAALEKNRAQPARKRAVGAEDLIYIPICSGGPLIKISAAERPDFVLGQLIVLGVALFTVTLVGLTLWLTLEPVP
jgi:hypothetical protein